MSSKRNIEESEETDEKGKVDYDEMIDQVKVIVQRVIDGGDEDAIENLTDVMLTLTDDVKSSHMIRKLKTKFKACFKSDWSQDSNIYKVFSNTRPIRKDYDRANAHIMSESIWEIGALDGTKIQFKCGYSGDCDGDGICSYYILDDAEEDVDILYTIKKTTTKTAKAIGLTKPETITLLNAMFSSSFS